VHLNSLNLYLFINSSNSHLLNKLPKKTSLIYRNYSKINCKKEILEIKKICKKKKLKFYLSNNIKLAIQLKLDGVYIPSFNKSLNLNNFKHSRKKLTILGSAHNALEIKLKEKQGVNLVFLSPLFLTKDYKHNLGIVKFNLMTKITKTLLVPLGGIRVNNINKLKMLKTNSLSGITFFNQIYEI
jgi:thiamine-phosphate pyrophosphorylase